MILPFGDRAEPELSYLLFLPGDHLRPSKAAGGLARPWHASEREREIYRGHRLLPNLDDQNSPSTHPTPPKGYHSNRGQHTAAHPDGLHTHMQGEQSRSNTSGRGSPKQLPT